MLTLVFMLILGIYNYLIR